MIRLIKDLFYFSVFLFTVQPIQANVVCMCVTTPVTFLEAIDGDSLWVSKDGKRIRVQLAGIDAPELKQDSEQNTDCTIDLEKAQQARDLLTDLLSSAKKVGLVTKEEDPGGDILAEVYADGLSVGQELLYKYLAVEGQGDWCD